MTSQQTPELNHHDDQSQGGTRVVGVSILYEGRESEKDRVREKGRERRGGERETQYETLLYRDLLTDTFAYY